MAQSFCGLNIIQDILGTLQYNVIYIYIYMYIYVCIYIYIYIYTWNIKEVFGLCCYLETYYDCHFNKCGAYLTFIESGDEEVESGSFHM